MIRLVNISEDQFLRTVAELVERNAIIARQQTILDEREGIIERLFKLTDKATVMLRERQEMVQTQGRSIERLTATIKWLHEQIQEMDASAKARDTEGC